MFRDKQGRLSSKRIIGAGVIAVSVVFASIGVGAEGQTQGYIQAIVLQFLTTGGALLAAGVAERLK